MSHQPSPANWPVICQPTRTLLKNNGFIWGGHTTSNGNFIFRVVVLLTVIAVLENGLDA